MHLLIIEPELHGHKAFYLSLIVKAFQGNQITLLTQPDHPALKEHFDREKIPAEGLEIIAVESKRVEHVFTQAQQLSHLRKFDEVFIPYLDHYLPSILASPEALHGAISGIWFHPYALDYFYRWMPPIDKRSRLRGRLHRKLHCPKATAAIKHIYFLDPEAPRRLKSLNLRIQSSVLPDPGEREPQMGKKEARDYFKLPHDRRIFLHAGSPEKRKGLPDVLRAFKKLIREPAQRKRIFLLRVGPNERLAPKEKAILSELIELGCAHVTEGFVNSQDFIEYFAAADTILIPYRNFRFSSGILANAKIAQRPVICSDYGMIGKTVQSQHLGDCFKHGSVRKLAISISAFRAASCEFRPKTESDFISALKRGEECHVHNLSRLYPKPKF